MSDIIVKFKPQGEKRLIAAIKKLELWLCMSKL